jgi:hypothetical protein
MRTFLIASGAYVEPELEAEFGRIPPAFLPLGNQRLFQHQRAAIGDAAGRILLSVPESFAVDPFDQALLDEAGIEVVFVPEALNLGQSQVYVVNVTASAGVPLTILHGDTLLRGLDLNALDAVSVDRTPPSGYRWGFARVDEAGVRIAHGEKDPDANAVLTGFFSFSSTALFVQSVTRRGGSFLEGLADYAEARPMQPQWAEEWLDFGHSGTYHRSRRRVTTERAFNRLTSTRRTVVKSGRVPRKIEAEARWFEALPPRLRLYTPAYLGRRNERDRVAYETEYLHFPNLSDLFVFGQLPGDSWETVFGACDEFLCECRSHPAPGGDASRGLYLDKTLQRLETFARDAGIDLSAPCRLNGKALPSLTQMAERAAAAVPLAESGHLSVVHGDFCFSNILYDLRAARIRTVDPRGLDAADRFSPFGDIRYDIGKLFHSAIGLYDHILAGRYRVRGDHPLDLSLELPDGPALAQVQRLFLESRFAGLTPAEAAAPAIAVLLFFSMLPLHADDRQRQSALLADGMRLFRDLDRRGGLP